MPSEPYFGERSISYSVNRDPSVVENTLSHLCLRAVRAG